MSPTEIIDLPIGPRLDQAVHEIVYRSKDKVVPPYSVHRAAAVSILDVLPMFVASIDPGRPDYVVGKPFVAGRLQWEKSVKGDTTILRVLAETMEAAICRAALIIVSQTGAAITRAPAPAPAPTMAERINKATAGKRAAKLAVSKPVALPRQQAQPLARVTTRISRDPLPPRKPFLPGAVPQAPSQR